MIPSGGDVVGRIKSSAEIIQEKLAAIGDATEEERLQWKVAPEGEKIAARFLKEDVNLKDEIAKYDGKAQDIYISSIIDVLMRNITLPRNEVMRKTTQKAMDGIRLLKKDKVAVDKIYAKIKKIFDHYEQNAERQKKDAYESLKREFEQRFMEAIRQQTGISGNARIKIDVERQPQFQEEWQHLQSQLESQYINLLEEYKKELEAVK